MYSDLVYDTETKLFDSKCNCGTIHKKERKKFTMDQKDPVN
jgi:hypothetical protein